MAASPTDCTRLMTGAASGDAAAADALLPLVYDELRKLAHHRLAHEPSGQTLQTTALVHEVFLRLVGDPNARWDGRGHFFASAATAMRRILIERARRTQREKHGGGRKRLSLDDADIADEQRCDDVLALDEALKELEAKDPRKARIVMLRYFAGLTIEQTAEAMELSKTTVKDEWQFARAWLHGRIRQGEPNSD